MSRRRPPEQALREVRRAPADGPDRLGRFSARGECAPTIRSSASRSGLGKERWVVERTFAWLHNLRRLRIRCERSADLHLAFMLLGCAVLCQRRLSGA
jgi:transposase